MRPDLQPSHQLTPSAHHYRLAWLLLFILHPSSLILSQTPVLRIETGSHTAKIGRIATDAQGRWLVTASHDKTPRVWELPSGRLLRVLRPPIGDGDEGKLYAVAMSPDGNTIAVGGFTGASGQDKSIYLFDRASGQLRQRLTGLPSAVLHLAYARDGRWLAATLGAGGLRVYAAAAEYALAYSDPQYSNQSYGADFDAAGRLATSCFDGQLRLYARDAAGRWQRIAQQPAPHGQRPLAVSFTADGTRLAIGYDDTTQVSVVAGRDLTPLFAPDTRGVDNGDLSKVVWSADGQTLYAGGLWSVKDQAKPIRQWDNGGRGAARDTVTAARNTIFHLVALPAGGGVLYSAGDPVFGLIEGGGVQRLTVTAALADYRNNLDGFRVSGDAQTVAFGYDYGGRSPARFSVGARILAVGAVREGLAAPVMQSDGLTVTDWKNSYEPKLNGQALKLKQYEFARSLALAADGSTFLLGTEFALRLYERDGRERWQKAIPGVVWSVNLSGDGRLAVAAFSDGTIRWYRVTDGAELLALFPHNDKKRWVLWTPQGYYDASAGAESLIGWHVNNGPDAAADFYPLARFFEQYYRPDIVSEVLATASTVPEVLARRGEKERANAAVAIKRPPRVAFLAQSGALTVDAEQFELCLAAEDLGGGVDEVRLYQNGKLVNADAAREIGLGAGAAAKSIGCNADTRQIGLGTGRQQQRRFVVMLLEGVNQFRGIGLSQDRIESAPAELSVTLRGTQQTADLHLLTVGINRYKNPDMSLNFAEPDANGIRDFFASAAPKKLFRNTVFHHLLNENAKLADIRKALTEVQTQARPQDVVVIYLAGQGTVLDNIWYFVPHDMTAPEDDAAIKNGSFSTIELAQSLRAIKAQKIFVMIDACKSGGALLALRGVEDRKALAQLARSTGTYLIAASTDTQLASEVKALGHGVFTHVLLEGLKGKAGAGKITVEAVMQYVKNALPDVSEKYRSRAQYPVSQGYGTDFPLVVY